jgi:hypothetical protein
MANGDRDSTEPLISPNLATGSFQANSSSHEPPTPKRSRSWRANAATEYANGGRDPRDIAPARPMRRAVLITVADHS